MKTDKEHDTTTVSAKSAADKIWDQVKNIRLDMFGLPNQAVHKYCKKLDVEPSKLYLTFSVGAFLPAFEEAIKDSFVVERTEKYLIVTPKV
jgi:hypothetical protein